MHVRRLDDAQRREHEGIVQVLLAEKRYEGCGGLDVDERIAGTIAGQAAFLLLGRETAYFERLRTVLVYPTEYVAHDVEEREDGTVIEGEQRRAGESWGDADALVLAWDEAGAGARGRAGRYNVILHEFAHRLDSETGADDGLPRLTGEMNRATWGRAMQAAYDDHRASAEAGRFTFIDPYGAEHPAEFFAVLTEHFFMEGETLARRHPDLYDLLQALYHIDPATWTRPVSEA